MSKQIKFIIALMLILTQHASAQVDPVSHVYGLIVGVSDYKDNAFKDLKFADDDAIMFADFLKSQLVKPADTGNIILLTNKKATAIPVWNEIYKIQQKAKAGDTVYLYFSGHGSAYTPEDIFIICHDAAKGQLDAGGCVNINSLKNRIKIMLANNVKVILITDACRSNEVSDIATGLLFTEALSKNAGELQFTSCSSNEKSLEDRRWGKGHGVFTWYLLKGWMGMADINNNKRVTFEELSNYVSRFVGKDTYDSIADRSMQTPYFCCSKYNSTLMATVNPDVKKKLIESEESGDNNLYAALFPRFATRSSEDDDLKDSMAIEYYAKLNEMIDKEQFLQPDSNCALFYYEKFRERQKNGNTLEESRLDLIAGMANKAQSFIQEYLQGEDSIPMPEFYYASMLMNKSVALMDSTNEMYTSLRARALFLEANSMMGTQSEMSIAFSKLDSSLELEPNKAYVYYSKAKIYEKFSVYYKQAEENYLKAIELAPRWVFPLIDLGDMYINAKKYDKGRACFNKAISIQPGPYMYTLLGHNYHQMSDNKEHADSALLYYNKALAIDSTYIDAILGIAIVYLSESLIDQSVEYYLKALALDSTYFYTHLSFGDLFYDAYYNEKAESSYKKALEYNPKCMKANWMLGNLYDFRLDDKVRAVNAYNECLKLDFYYTKAYTAIGNIYIGTEQYMDAIAFLKYPLTYDPNYNPINLARAYLNRAPNGTYTTDYDSAKLWLDTSDHYFPDEYYTNYLFGFYYWKLDSADKSISYCKKSAILNNTFYNNWLTLGHNYYFLKKDYDSAIYYYKMGIKESPQSEDCYTYLRDIYHFIKKDYHNAILTANVAIENNANKHHFFFLNTLSYMENEQYTEALVTIDSAIKIYPEYSIYHFYKASVLSSLNQTNASLDAMEAAIKANLNAERADFYGGKFKSLEGNKKFEKMVKKYLKDNNKQP